MEAANGKVKPEYNFDIETSNNGRLNVPLTPGGILFVVGANGVGKSTLMHNLFFKYPDHSKRILAHRQTWLSNSFLQMSASQKNDNERYIRSWDKNSYSRWKDDYSSERSGISLFDLVNAENSRARNIAGAVGIDNIDLALRLSANPSPIDSINELLILSNINVSIILGENDELLAVKNDSKPYSIAELSDGERNALLICSDVLTAEPSSLIILDEPERHLHRSIVSPLLSSLFQKRKDCAFVISTHDVSLPIDDISSSILLLRSCEWEEKIIKSWDADLISNADSIPVSVKHNILGAKRKILFVEGENKSLDRQIYQLIFPLVSVIAQKNCIQVEKAVEGIRQTGSLHWIEAYGLVDADDRTTEQIERLLDRGIVALECYSVEFLYYNLEIIKRIARRYSKLLEIDEETLFGKAISEIIGNISPHKERLCSRMCEKKVRSRIMSSLPKHSDILKGGQFEVVLNLDEFRQKEEKKFDCLVAENNFDGLLSRYPIRETPVLNGIVNGLGLTIEKYESSVRKLIIDDSSTREFYTELLSNLTKVMTS